MGHHEDGFEGKRSIERQDSESRPIRVMIEHDELEQRRCIDCNPSKPIPHLHAVLMQDELGLTKARASYGESWCQRGGIGAYMMLCRKWDRLEQRVKACGWDVFAAIVSDTRREGAIDDIRDLRRYLALVEAKLIEQHRIAGETVTKDSTKDARLPKRTAQQTAQIESDVESGDVV